MLDVDVTHQINSVRRQVGSRTLEAGEARTVTISQSYDTTLEDLWDACTNPERIPRWFLPVSGELRLHGRYQIEGNAGGVVERCDAPKSFAITWEMGDQVSWVEVRLTPEDDGRTRFELEHTALVGDHWDQFGPGAVGIGWDMTVMGLALHLSSGEANDPEASAAWVASDEARVFMKLSSDLWGEADAASGTDPATARAAADRTFAAYTGAPPTES
ncbi:activator of HSP90 ATPase [Sphaerisporangium melleum]|uniref:Activator of HSP90 ATPase n=1 Tax=Sphaerisporangium melleum TaxID=321316 RepID=A0A917QWJ7_9ACTN|nr:SRPBCC family protein [Sphaerisporangium melleum]GGK71610.1 activator of HSP90 ATPase [Sphaerisporangium melleum]GII70150.1 activator of HSP90 ATPase [Sphaerisporangium melleum]